MNTSRRGFLTRFGKATAVGAVASVIKPAPAVEVREVTKIVEKEVVSYERKPRPDLSKLPVAFLKKEIEGSGSFTTETIIATGPLGDTYLHRESGWSREWSWRWDDHQHGAFETTIDQMSVSCGARVDEDDLFHQCFGDRAYARRLAKRAWRLGAHDKARLLMEKYRLARWHETGEPR